jgi:hypothetical protein
MIAAGSFLDFALIEKQIAIAIQGFGIIRLDV